MKKITFLVLLFSISLMTTAKGQDCDLIDTTSFTGSYQMEQIIPSVFGFETFTDGSGMQFTLFSEVTDDSQAESGIPLTINQRSFDAAYIPGAGVGQAPQTFIIEFTDCGVTFSEIELTGLQCSTVLRLGPVLSGGNFSSDNDNEFTLTFEDNVDGDCGLEPAVAEIRFFKGATLVCQPDITVTADSGNCEATVSFEAPVATDIDGSTIVAEQTGGPVSGSVFPVGITAVQFSVISTITGQMSNCSFNIIVTEDVAPTIECPENTVIPTDSPDSGSLPDFTSSVVVSDNCNEVADLVITQDPLPGTPVFTDETVSVTLTVTDSSGNQTECSFDVTSDASLSLDNVSLENEISLYPNPTRGAITINNSGQIPLTQIVISDINGRILQTLEVSSSSLETKINLDNYTSGIYFARISTENGNVVKRIVKQ